VRRRWIARLVVIALLAGAIFAAAAWIHNGLLDRFFPRYFRVVEPGRIYAAGQIDRHLLPDIIRRYKIAVIVSLTSDPGDPDDDAEPAIAASLGVTRFDDVLAGDGTGDIARYADALQQIVAADRAGKAVLFHCHSGVQRSGACTVFYRIFMEGWPGPRAVSELEHNHWDVARNAKMLPYMNTHMAELGRLLMERGVIDQVPDPLPVLVP
jgi:predicted protein tyrosine phosphatase